MFPFLDGDVPRRASYVVYISQLIRFARKVQVGKDQEKAQSEKDSHSKKPRREKTKPTIRHTYHETNRKSNEQLFSQ